MAFGRKKQWQSEFAKRLQIEQQTETVEEAVIKCVNKRLSLIKDATPPIDLSLVASLLDIDPKIRSSEMEQSGRLVRDGKRAFIEVNAGENRGRQRFTTAHEIAHRILTPSMGSAIQERGPTNKSLEHREEERLCDLAAQWILLLRPEYLHPIIFDYGFSFVAIDHISRTFAVSTEVAVRAMVDMADIPLAVVYCIMGFRKGESNRQLPLLADSSAPQPKLRITRCYPSQDFAIEVPKNKSIVETSCAYEAYNSRQRKQSDEKHSFNGRVTYLIRTEAQPTTIYIQGHAQEGIILLLKNPQLL
jgi:Zn-dependent peptidase ImmA (M78 family)